MNETLKALALKYETKEFLIGDPSWFMHQVEGDSNKELLAFIASTLSYGSRKQFLPKIQYILDCINCSTHVSAETGSVHVTSGLNPVLEECSVHVSSADMLVSSWLTSGSFNVAVPANDDCFYRLYTNRTFNDFLSALACILKEWGSLKAFVSESLHKINSPKTDANLYYTLDAVRLITSEFARRGSVGVIPKNTQSSCKRVCMFLRWMVRNNSPVDLGLWSDIIDKRTLIIPMDTHVMQEANRMGLISSKTASMATALKLSSKLRDIFPDDPLKGDFALFGLGVDEG